MATAPACRAHPDAGRLGPAQGKSRLTDANDERVAAGPLGAEPLLVQVGFTRFALRRAEAARVRLRMNGAGE